MIPVVSVASDGQNVWIKIVGRGNFQCSPCLKQIVEEQEAEGEHDYTIDLEQCEQLDSTFMGTLTGIAQRLKNKQKGSVCVINVSDSNKELMENLGLDQLFPIRSLADGREFPPSGADGSFSEVALAATISKDAVEQTIRSAHEALVTANKENVPKFQSLLEIIR